MSFSPNGAPILMSATVTASETGGALATTLPILTEKGGR